MDSDRMFRMLADNYRNPLVSDGDNTCESCFHCDEDYCLYKASSIHVKNICDNYTTEDDGFILLN